MKIGIVSDSLTSTAGGIFEIERCLALALRDLGVDVSAWGVRDERWEPDGPLWGTIECRLRERTGPRSFGFARGWIDDLARSGCDLLHLQHLWMYPSIAAHRWHRRTRRPFLVTPNGMLDPWTLRNSGWKKRLAALAYENRMLRAAACLQANTEKELADFRAYGLRNPVALIPNGVTLPEVGGRRSDDQGQGTTICDADSRSEAKSNHGQRTLLFLGRLHPKKGLVNALRAWKEVTGHGSRVIGREEWRLAIAGWDQNGHEAELQRLCRELGLFYSTRNQEPRTRNEERVAFLGPAFGEAKDALLRSADAFLLPSFSEGLPMAVLEAWAYRVPVLMTEACNLPEGFAADAALRIGTDPDSIAGGMRGLFERGEDERRAMGAAGRRLVEERFTWPKVAAQMKEVYEWMLGGGTKPGFVE